MADYIDKQAFLDYMKRTDRYFNVKFDIENFPNTDVAPIRHGRWIEKGEYAVCTEGGVRSGTQYDGVEPIPLMTQFCPNCGAKMDEKEDKHEDYT